MNSDAISRPDDLSTEALEVVPSAEAFGEVIVVEAEDVLTDGVRERAA